jgi:hypothetical protein
LVIVMNMGFRLSGWLVVAGAVIAGSGIAVGQTNPYVRPPAYYPGYPYPGGFYPGTIGGAYYGQADLVRAQGELTIMTEQARSEREKANQAKLETKRKAFDQMMYEKANTPTLTEDLQYEAGLSTQRLIASPMPAEIAAGKTLNAMMPMIASLSLKGAQGPVIPLNQNQLHYLNVTVGKEGPTLGMLSDGGAKLNWPLGLQGPKQEKVAAQIPVLVSEARTGSVDAKLYREVTNQLSQINEDLRKQFHKEEIDGGEFLECRRFLDSLTQSVQALRSPTSQRVLDGSYAAKGRTVPELVDYMTKNGLSFAPSNPGQEAVYQAMHEQFAAYTTSAQAAAGFQVRYNPPRTDPWKVK